ncbi:MAG: dihydrolipoyllysine-residue acetyltransferase [Endozoicomonadaceae bacterium]|nr:dihydrolipoyllysine-residue acetyltransferase [Endozoicomonadaceae bacterium]
MTEFTLKELGQNILECELMNWHIHEGEYLAVNQPICDIKINKNIVSVLSKSSGKVNKLYYRKGDTPSNQAPLFSIDIPVKPCDGSTMIDTNKTYEDFILPDVGEGIAECEIVDWFIKEGDFMEEDQPVCDILTDKALIQIPAKASGKLVKQYYKKGEIAKVHTPLFHIEITTQNHSEIPQTDRQPKKNKILTSPSVRRLARELNIDLQNIVGSDDNQRIYKSDLLQYKEAQDNLSNSTQDIITPSLVLQPETHTDRKSEPINGIKAAMAKKMQAAVQIIPHFSLFEEVDITNLMQLQKTLNEKSNHPLPLLAFFIKSLSLALQLNPGINVQTNEQCTELYYLNNHNIGIAVDSKIGLLVPNIKQCQLKSIQHISQEFITLKNQAKSGRISPDILKGGTITISNFGSISGLCGTPIINHPEACIVGLGKTRDLPRFDENNNITSRKIMMISWSADHRLIDGGTLARLSAQWKNFLENPVQMLATLT